MRIFIILLCYLPLFNLVFAEVKLHNQPISLNFYQADIDVILQSLAEYQQLNLVMEDNIDNKQTINLKNIDWHKALTIVTRSADLEYDIDDNVLFVKRKADPLMLYQQRLQQQKEAELQQPLSYLSLMINHADIKSIRDMITQQGLLSERGNAFIDERTHSLIVHDLDQQFTKIKSLVKQVDSPLPQVHISAHIVTMSNESIDEMGIKWGYSGSSSQPIDYLDIGLGVANAPSTIGFNLAKHSGHLLGLELSALEAENQLEIIASPNLLTSHQHTASIKQGTEIPYEVSSGNNGSTTIEFKQAVLGLEVTPRILENNQVELVLYITQNNAGRTIKRSDGGEALAIETQEIKTQVIVNNGETLVLGGIFQQKSTNDQQSVPGMSKIPLVGNLFKYNGKMQQRRELVIFITPQLVELSSRD